jgi:hypothetical protein
VGGDRFILGGSADAEQHLFVIANPNKPMIVIFTTRFNRSRR